MVDERGMGIEVGETGLAIAPPQDLKPLTKTEYLDRIELMESVVNKMKDSVDYGQIPGTQSKTLYLPGAELLRMVFNIPVRSEVQERNVDMDKDGGYVMVRVRGWVEDGAGNVHYEITRTCSSMEPRFKPWRHQERRHELIDLVEERAQKRAFVMCVRHMTGASRYFKGADVDAADSEQGPAQPAPTQSSITTDRCPIHGTAWYDGNWGQQHVITGTRDYCRPSKAYWQILSDAFKAAGQDPAKANEWFKVRYTDSDGNSATLSKLSAQQIVDAIERIAGETEVEATVAQQQEELP